MKRFLAAWGFLTVFPTPLDDPDGAILRRSAALFPVVGLVLGGAGFVAAWIFWTGLTLPPLFSAVALTVFLGAVSGGLHLDGLADSCDGFLSRRPRERILEIMRDSRIGSMGVLGLLAVMGLKVAAFSGLVAPGAVIAGMIVPVAGRTALVFSMWLEPPARREGLGQFFYDGLRPVEVAAGVAGALAVEWLMGRFPAVLAVLVALLVAWVWAWHCHRVIGGTTGDTLGAACELAECAAAVTLLVLTALQQGDLHGGPGYHLPAWWGEPLVVPPVR